MADKLIICVSQHQALFDGRQGHYREDNLWQSIMDQLGSANGE